MNSRVLININFVVGWLVVDLNCGKKRKSCPCFDIYLTWTFGYKKIPSELPFSASVTLAIGRSSSLNHLVYLINFETPKRQNKRNNRRMGFTETAIAFNQIGTSNGPLGLESNGPNFYTRGRESLPMEMISRPGWFCCATSPYQNDKLEDEVPLSTFQVYGICAIYAQILGTNWGAMALYVSESSTFGSYGL